MTFLVARSGLGKSIACYRKLTAHVEAGGFGIILPHDVLTPSITLEQAITKALQQLHPALSSVGETAFSLCSPEQPILLIVEDINRSGQAQFLTERITGWSHSMEKEQNGSLDSKWRVVCPLWPEFITLLGDQTQKRIDPLLLIFDKGFTEQEGCEAVLARAKLKSLKMSSLTAQSIAHALGQDPLLIALHDIDTTPDPNKVISQFVNNALSRAADMEKKYPAADYHDALRALAGEMLAHRKIELNWREVSGWMGLLSKPLGLLGCLAHQGELLRFTGSSSDQHLSFRHDRVRDWLLVDAAAELERQDILPADIIAEPYFVEVMGAVLVRGQFKSDFLRCITETNPLALFHALRLFGEPTQAHHQEILQAIDRWLDNPMTHERANLHLRWEALAMLADTDSRQVLSLVQKFRDQMTDGQLACFRNGNLAGGIMLCIGMEPGVNAPWRDAQIEHAKIRYGTNLNRTLEGFLKRMDLDSPARIGALRLAGHVADPDLAPAIEACWNADNERGSHLADYLWAFSECCGYDPRRFLYHLV